MTKVSFTPIAIVVILGFVLFKASGCGKQSDVELQAEYTQLMSSHYKRSEENGKLVAAEFSGASDSLLADLLNQCQAAVMDMAREEYKPFEPIIVDQYSADALQAATYISGGRIQKAGDIQERVKAFRAETKRLGVMSPRMLDSTFSLLVTQDSFSGPHKISREARCEFLPGFKVQAQWKAL
jgi:hypothetical protein